MSIKNMLAYFFIASIAITIISCKEETGKKFLSRAKQSDPLTIFSKPLEKKSFSSGDSKYINIKCLFSNKNNIYSLQGLENKKEDYTITDLDGEDIKFNFCRNTFTDEEATFVKIVDDKKIKLAGNIDGEGDAKENKNVWIEEEGGISISFVQGEECPEGGNYNVILSIACNPDVDGTKFLETLKIVNDTNTCQYQIYMDSLYGCSLKSLYLLIKLLNDYKIVFCIVFIIVGLAFCLFGNRFITYTIIFSCGLIGCYLITAIVLSSFPNFITSELYLFICLLVCFVLGCIIGYFLKGDINSAVLILGAFLGYSCSVFLYQIIQNYVDFNPEILYYVCIGVCVVIGAFIGYKLSKPILIIGSAVFGGYLTMRGISLVVGNYLDEQYIIDLIKRKEWEQLKEIRGTWTYLYLGIWIVLSVIGIVVQCKNAKKMKNKK